MNEQTLKALKGSIKKWEKIVAGKGIDTGYKNCPLCKLFNSGKDCDDACPIKLQTGISGCDGTPYEEWCDHQYYIYIIDQDRKTRRVFKIRPDCKRLAQAELDFLISLLPEGEVTE